MKESLFILLVVGILAALTAVKYRKQIAGMIGVARMLRDARTDFVEGRNKVIENDAKSIPLVNCTRCGVWVPQNRAIKVGNGFECLSHRLPT